MSSFEEPPNAIAAQRNAGNNVSILDICRTQCTARTGGNDSSPDCILHFMPALRLVMALLLALPLASQSPIIRATAPLVVLSTSVTDRQGKSIDGLTSADFVL